jgi:CDP-diacylglycerol--serine O-phosphatidyltransferase
MRLPRSVVPNAITLLGLVLGFAGMARAVQGDYLQCAWLVCIAGLLDVLDGRVATLLHATSEFGGQLDSFTDLVAFGCAPAFLVYILYFEPWGVWGIALGSFPVVCATIRLARYNLQEHGAAGSTYTGLTTPMGAGLLVGYVLLTQSQHESQRLALFAAGVTVTASVLMVSTIRLDSDEPFHPPAVLRKWRGYWLISFLPAVAIFPRYAVFLWPAMLSVYSVLRAVFASLPLHRGRREADVPGLPDRLSPEPERRHLLGS